MRLRISSVRLSCGSRPNSSATRHSDGTPSAHTQPVIPTLIPAKVARRRPVYARRACAGDELSEHAGRVLGMSDGSGALTKPLMFLASYAPLFAIFVIRFDGIWLRIVCALLAVTGMLGLIILLRSHHSPDDEQGEHHLTEVTQAGEGASSYLAGYLLPFVTIGSPSTKDLVAYVLFFLVAYLVHVRTSIIQVNPTLFLLGWKVYLVTDCRGFRGHLLARAKLPVLPGNSVFASRLTGDMLLLERLANGTSDGRRETCPTDCP